MFIRVFSLTGHFKVKQLHKYEINIIVLSLLRRSSLLAIPIGRKLRFSSIKSKSFLYCTNFRQINMYIISAYRIANSYRGESSIRKN